MILDRFKLTGKVAIVTGAGRGIGRACAIALAQAGAIPMCVARSEDQVADTAAQINADGMSASFVTADVTDLNAVQRIVDQTVAEFGRLDLLLNNAGGGGQVATSAITEADVERAYKLNFLAPVYLIRECASRMPEAGGAVVNISSGYARVANVGAVPYGGAKAAQEQATRMLAMEYGPRIRVNGIRVGAIQTENMKTRLLQRDSEVGKKLCHWTPAGRLGDPEDIAAGVIYLLSDAGSFLTGKILDIDGGIVTERSVMEIIHRADTYYSSSNTNTTTAGDNNGEKT